MDIILVPGLWLDGASWERVVPTLERAGHRTHPLTLPGMESRDADRSRVTLADHVARAVHVAGFPVGDGATIADAYPAEHGEVPLPDWSASDEADLARAILASIERAAGP
jgi:hypothetical protein